MPHSICQMQVSCSAPPPALDNESSNERTQLQRRQEQGYIYVVRI